MTGELNNSIIGDFENSFRTNCLTLIGAAYKWLKETQNITVDWDEENISANILKHIQDSRDTITRNIYISDECRIYNQAILNNKKKAKSALRIDLKLSTNWAAAAKRIDLFVEAKNLIENNCSKQGRITLNAKKLQKRYISTGIDPFVSSRYPSDRYIILGYILEGATKNIVKHLNKFLINNKRYGETLKKKTSNIPYLDDIYVSTHPNNHILNHYFLKF